MKKGRRSPSSEATKAVFRCVPGYFAFLSGYKKTFSDLVQFEGVR